ncbi:MAG: type II toxin-antitoxin system HicB family antitoxin [Treponema sp.]|jgi:predicted RNase H-like HicB family nuclease|nr:type II toxin-antitoxin system HicB family antitoxin [Treponema sp.]
MMGKNYIAFLEFDRDTGKYGVVFPDFSGLTTVGNNYDDAIKMAHEALAFHIESMIQDKEHIPVPSTLEEIENNWAGLSDWKNDVGDYIVAYISVIPPFGTQKVLLSMDAGLIARIDRVAKNRSAFMASAAEYMLDSKFTSGKSAKR